MSIPEIDWLLGEIGGLQTKIWIQGLIFTRDPGSIILTRTRAEAQTQTSSLGLRTDRLYVKPGWANVLEKHAVMMTWPDIRNPNLLNHLNLLTEFGQPFHVAIWKPVFETFDGDGTRADFFLQRRLALGYAAPLTDFPNFPTRVIQFDAPFTNAESPWPAEPQPTTVTLPTITHKNSGNILLGTPAFDEVWIEDDGHVEGDRWLTRVRFGTPPPPIVDSVVIQYLPLYRVVVQSEDPRTYREAMVEGRGIKFAEL